MDYSFFFAKFTCCFMKVISQLFNYEREETKMKTNNMKNFLKKIDESIPEATSESVKDQCCTIAVDLKNTGKCAMATLMCITGTAISAYTALEDSAMLGLMISKTATKKICNEVKNFYNETPAMAVVR